MLVDPHEGEEQAEQGHDVGHLTEHREHEPPDLETPNGEHGHVDEDGDESARQQGDQQYQTRCDQEEFVCERRLFPVVLGVTVAACHVP